MMRLAYQIFTDIVKNGAYANLALKKGLRGADERTARSVTALVYEAIEHVNHADLIIDSFAKGRLHGSVRNILRLGVTALLFTDMPDHAAVQNAVELTRAVKKGALSGYVNGVLRSVARARDNNTLPPLPEDPAERLSVLYGMPVFMAREYIEDYGEAFAEAMLSSRLHELTVRAQYPFTTEALEKELSSLGIPFERGRFDPNAFILKQTAAVTETELFKTGRIAVQSESAMLVCRACRVKDGMRILDTCAAPGGKSAYLSSLMHGSGSIDAWELHPHRAELTRETFSRLGCKNCRVETRDASVSEPGETPLYDVVLVDAPCSGLGGGSKPDAMLNRTREDIASLAELQAKLLSHAALFVRKGGALVYSTCTVSRRENRGNAEAFLASHPDFEAEALDIVPGREGPFLQLFPNTDGVDGFFIARFIKK